MLTKSLHTVFHSVGFKSVRGLSCGKKYVEFSKDEQTKFVTMQLHKPPVNTINMSMINEISGVLTECEDENHEGLILTSKIDGVFSGGIDILEIYKPNPERLKKYWKSLQDTWLKLYKLPTPTVSVVNGHSFAGGCALNLACEYVIMCRYYSIGLNETALGK